jgi:hypothetical protein
MPKQVDKTAGEIDWPAWADRTGPRRRERTSKFSVTLASAFSDIETELEDRIDVDYYRISTAAPHRKSDGLPYADAGPEDPGVAVRWTMDGNPYCIAADHYTDLRDNARAIGLYITEKRKMGNRPVHTGQDEFATARLPPGDGEEDVVVAGGDVHKPHEVLGVAPDAPEAVIRGAYRELLKERHPDHGGTAKELKELNRSKEALLE